MDRYWIVWTMTKVHETDNTSLVTSGNEDTVASLAIPGMALEQRETNSRRKPYRLNTFSGASRGAASDGINDTHIFHKTTRLFGYIGCSRSSSRHISSS